MKRYLGSDGFLKCDVNRFKAEKMLKRKAIVAPKIYISKDYIVENAGLIIEGDKIHSIVDAGSLKNKDIEVIEFENGFVCPGFQDNHLHLVMSAMSKSKYQANCFGTSPEDCIAKMKVVEDVRPKDKMMFGIGWYHAIWDVPEFPNKHMIDEVYPDRPVCMQSVDGHSLWCNTKGLEVLGITKDSVAPEGGIYEKDESGELTGIIQEQAATQLLTKIYDYTMEEYKTGFKAFLKYLRECGITGVSDMAVLAIPGMDLVREDIYQELEKDGDLTCRVSIYPQGIMDVTRALNMKEELKDSKLLRLGGMKQFYDGVIPSHTGWMFKDYDNAEFEGDKGEPVISEDEMRKLVFNANKHGLSMRIHSVGPHANQSALDIFEESQKEYGHPTIGRNGLEHVDNILIKDCKRFKELDVSANVQPPHLVFDMDTIHKEIGLERTKLMWAFKNLEDAGAPISIGTDSPVVDANPMNVLYTAVYRRDPNEKGHVGGWYPEQKLSMKNAIHDYTYGSSYANGSEKIVGTLDLGMKADLIVLDKDLLNCAEDELMDTKVLLTMVDGEIVLDKR